MRKLGAAASLVVLVSTVSCVFDVGIGDRNKSKVDPLLSGDWYLRDTNGLDVLRATPDENGKVYRIDYLACHGTIEKPVKKEKQGRLTGIAWLTTIGGVRFATLEIEKDEDGSKVEKPYAIFKIEHAGDKLNLFGLREHFGAFKVKTSADLERAIKDNLTNKEAFSEPGEFQRVPSISAKAIAALFQ